MFGIQKVSVLYSNSFYYIIPDRTRELVQLQKYLKTSVTETMPVLNQKIGVAVERVLFLLDCTLLPTEDIQLNTRVFQWPKDMASVFELAKTRTGHKRDQVEEALRAQIDEFEDNLRYKNNFIFSKFYGMNNYFL